MLEQPSKLCLGKPRGEWEGKKITQLLFLSLQIPLSSRFFAFLAYFPSFPRALAAFRKLCFVFVVFFTGTSLNLPNFFFLY